MKRLAIVLIAAVCAMLALPGCSAQTVDANDNKIDRFDDGGWCFNSMNVIVDRETGVEYLIVEGLDNEMAICPLYEADGTMSTKEEA